LDDWREGVGIAVLGKHAGAREWEMRATDHHLVGDDPVESALVISIYCLSSSVLMKL
jgi:hypothetical protein